MLKFALLAVSSGFVAHALDGYAGGSGVVTTDPIKVAYKDQVIVYHMPVDYTYHRANLMCQQQGSHLASIHDSYTEAAIIEGMTEVGLTTDAWIGLYVADGGSKWEWEDSSQVNWERWKALHPLQTTETRRGTIQADGQWVDQIQTHTGTSGSTHVSRGIVCAGHSFALVLTTKNWNDANEACKSYYNRGHLYTIHSSVTNERLRTLFNKYGDIDAWIGFKDDADEGQYYWIDGTPTTFLDWGGGQPNSGTSQNCATFCFFFDNYHWDDHYCTDRWSYLCATDSNHANSVVVGNYHVTDFYGTFDQAEQYCRETYDEHVGSIPDAATNEAIRKAADGLGVKELWIGYYASAGQTWTWTDGSDHVYDNWGEDQPVEHEHAQMDTLTGKWYNVAGTNILGGVVCNRIGNPSSPQEAQTVEDVLSSYVYSSHNNNFITLGSGTAIIAVLFAVYKIYVSPKSVAHAKPEFTYGSA